MSKRKMPKYTKIDDDVTLHLISDVRAEPQHRETREARIQPVWMHGKKPDADGVVEMGKMKVLPELDRVLMGCDALLLLNWLEWELEERDEAWRRALVDHELSHLAERLDGDCEPVVDWHGNKCWRIRKHDVEEFAGVVARHGLWTRRLQALGRTVADAQMQLDLAAAEEVDAGDQAEAN